MGRAGFWEGHWVPGEEPIGGAVSGEKLGWEEGARCIGGTQAFLGSQVDGCSIGTTTQRQAEARVSPQSRHKAFPLGKYCRDPVCKAPTIPSLP